MISCLDYQLEHLVKSIFTKQKKSYGYSITFGNFTLHNFMYFPSPSIQLQDSTFELPQHFGNFTLRGIKLRYYHDYVVSRIDARE